MATNFSPCKGSYVLNQFPSNVMFGMNGFHVSASGAIQGHHGPLVFLLCESLNYISSGEIIDYVFTCDSATCENDVHLMKYILILHLKIKPNKYPLHA